MGDEQKHNKLELEALIPDLLEKKWSLDSGDRMAYQFCIEQLLKHKDSEVREIANNVHYGLAHKFYKLVKPFANPVLNILGLSKSFEGASSKPEKDDLTQDLRP